MTLVPKLKSIIVLLTVLLAASACKKNIQCEVEYVDSYNLDTIYPSEYLGAYPGSWREYDNGHREAATAWESVPKHLSVIDSEGCNTVFRDYLIVPKVLGGYIYGDSVLVSNQSSNTSRITQMVGAVGDSWGYTENFENSQWGSGHKTHSWSIDSLLDFKEVNGVIYEDVLFVRMKYSLYYDENWGGPSDISHVYYARNIGKIQYKYFEYYGEEFPPNVEYGLEDYYMAPH
ncbi:MAG: hypothetical protein GQ574_26190 [Crocinitomix sp.]|nr:hypothetical protein [Crocinitomix sp.]